MRARFVRYEHLHVSAATLAISDIRIFGNGDGPKPEPPTRLAVVRDADRRNAHIEWDAGNRIVGVNIRWGIAPDKLYQTFQRFADEGRALDLRALTVDQHYYCAIESFDENGVSRLSDIVRID